MSFIDKFLSKLFGNKSDRDIQEIMPIVEKVKAEYDRMNKLSNDDLRNETLQLKAKIQEYIQPEEKQVATLKIKVEDPQTAIEAKEGIYKEIDQIEDTINNKIEEVLQDILPTAFAIVKDSARRFTENEQIEVTTSNFDQELAARYEHVNIEGDKTTFDNQWVAGGNMTVWGMIHYDVQLIGGVVLHSGKIAEMATGEGKTLVATLPVFLNALAGKGVHVVTVNDYLAKRDSEWMGPLYQFHGLSVDCIDKHQPNSEERRQAYLADITFGTNNEFGFDYLRDNMATNPEDLVQRKHHYAIVDEVDSVLIDDARTPLIISGPIPKGEDHQFDELKPAIESLVLSQRKLVTEILAEAKQKLKSDDSKVKEEGAMLLLRAHKGLPKNKAIIKFLSEDGMKQLMMKSENYYMQDNNKHMHIVTDSLYFIIEEKMNSIELTDKGHELLAQGVEDASFFVLPDVGSEVAEIENNESITEEEKLRIKDELLQNYAVKSERVHTINQLLKAYAMFEKDTEYVVMDNKVKIVDEQTGRIMEGRRYSDGLHQAIEAKENVKIEAATQTYATVTLQNYFRMYHKLSGMTGTAETEAGEFWDIYELDVVVIPTNRPIARNDEDDKVYFTNKEKYNAVIQEITALNEQGRPILVGTTSVEISELLSRMLKMRGIKHNVLNAKLHQREADIVAEAGNDGAVTIATNMAGRGTDIKLKQEIKDIGGLAIVGTERHESRRVDRQLRGRAGRQGDPGSSQFFVSFEDKLLRLFGAESMINLLSKSKFTKPEEGESIQSSMITKRIEAAQRKVEENNFGVRKNLLEYDDVMNSQREVIYKKRRHALYGERIDTDILNMMYDAVDSLVEEYHPQGSDGFEDFKFELIRFLSVEYPFNSDHFVQGTPNELTEELYKFVVERYERKVEAIREQAMPVIKDVYENQGHLYTNIVVPITDGRLVYNITCNLEKANATECRELVLSYQKQVILATIDDNWKEQLRELDDLRQSVRNAQYEQKDPLLIYKFESFNLFKTMVDKMNKTVVSTLMKGQIPARAQEEIEEAEVPSKKDKPKYQEQRSEVADQDTREKERVQPRRVEKKVGRNEPCPCGSGKKFKQCHGKH
ncbi:preprotein translocase subunit SecA [Halosquirtibacter xylanolyticus]|uniref:preprotein translocase subunit SecA n=1 Tax=Halosquirtibacter xylanolyticus TaxID=3374599 RepID=UPI003748B98F|nr:preprotein translocase subunit SecA [Prolixibacteraceae bacterium]